MSDDVIYIYNPISKSKHPLPTDSKSKIKNKDQQIAEIKNQFDNIQKDLANTKECLANLIAWLVMELGRENAKDLLDKLAETN